MDLFRRSLRSLTPLLCLLAATPLAAQDLVQYQDVRLTSHDAGWFATFGNWVAVDGDVALVGAPLSSPRGLWSGAAYVFRRDAAGSWQLEQELVPRDGDFEDQFGRYVSIHGDTALVSAFHDSAQELWSGSAYVFRYDPQKQRWEEEQKLEPGDPEAGAQFGRHVSIHGDVALVGANLADEQGNDSGSAYVFRYDPQKQRWEEEQKLVPPDGGPEEHFGETTSVADGMLIVGAHFHEGLGQHSGAAYVYRWDPGSAAWVLEQELFAQDEQAEHHFGESVAIWSGPGGDVALVGALFDGDLGFNAGAAYVFRRDPAAGTWSQEAKLLPGDGGAKDRIGYDVALGEDVALVAAFWDDDNGPDSGAAYVFRHHPAGGQWQEDSKLLATEGSAGDEFGRAVSLSGSTALLGARYHDALGPDAGAAYVVELDTLRPEPLPVLAGQPVTATVTGGAPLADTWLYYSRRGTGSTSLPSLGVTLDLAQGLEAAPPVASDVAGTASWTRTVPATVSGRRIWLQAAQSGWTSHAISILIH